MATGAMVNRGQYAAATALGAPRVEAGSQISYMRSTGDAFGFGAASRRLGLTPYQAAERMAYLSTRSNMGTLEGLQNFANRYFGGNLAAAREFMSYMNESGALARWRALANVARQTGIAPGNASDREAGMAMFNYLQTASVKDQYGDSYRLNNLLADLSNQTGLSQTEILRRMAGARGFTFTDRDGSVKTMKFDGNGNAVIARSEKGIPGPTNLGDGVVMQSGVVRTEGVGDNMVTTYSGVFSYTGRDGKQHTLEGSVAMDSKGNVVSIQGAGGAQVSDAVKEDFMNALSMGQKTNLEAGIYSQDPVQLIHGIATGQVDSGTANRFFGALKNSSPFRERVIQGVAGCFSKRMESKYGTKGNAGVGVSLNENLGAGWDIGLGAKLGGTGASVGARGNISLGGKIHGEQTKGKTQTMDYNMVLASNLVRGALEVYKTKGAEAAAKWLDKGIENTRHLYETGALDMMNKIEQRLSSPIVGPLKEGATQMIDEARQVYNEVKQKVLSGQKLTEEDLAKLNRAENLLSKAMMP